MYIDICVVVVTDEQQQQNYTVTTTKRSIYINMVCNFQLRRLITVRHILLNVPPIEASGGQEE